MPKSRKPRSGSMQYWPRKRAKRIYARIRSWAQCKDVKPMGFAGYKAGMTHLSIVDNRKTTLTKGEKIVVPVTIIECPPLKVASLLLYKKTAYGLVLSGAINAEKFEKELGRKIMLPKKQQKSVEIKPEDYVEIRLLLYTQPKLASVGKKKPEIFEVALGGSVADQFAFAKEKLGKEISISEVFAEGQQVDIHSITKGKGFQGPVKRFGVSIRQRKSEKTIRGPGNLGPWTGNRSWTVAHAGQMGFHQRTEYNKWLIKIGDNAKEINPKGGFVGYGLIKSNYVLLKGSVGGSTKRLIRLSTATRPNTKLPNQAPIIDNVNLESKQ